MAWHGNILPLYVLLRLASVACTKCSNTAMEGRSLCSEHWAEYMRDYRARAVPRRERAAHSQGFVDGVSACAAFLRVKIGDRAFTGYQVATLLEREHIAVETPEMQQRRAFIQSMQPPA